MRYRHLVRLPEMGVPSGLRHFEWGVWDVAGVVYARGGLALLVAIRIK